MTVLNGILPLSTIKSAVICACLFALSFATSSLVAQETTPLVPAEAEKSQTPSGARVAPVVIDGQTYFMVRGSLSISAEQRASDVQKRLVEAAEATSDPEPLIRLRSTDLFTEIYADDVLVTSVTAADAAFEGFETEIVAEFISEEIAKAIHDYRAIRSASSLERGVLNALVWSVVFVVLVGLLLIAWWYGRRYADAKVRHLLANVERRMGRVIDPADLTSGVRLLLNGFLTFVIAILTYYYIAFVLYEFGYTKALATVLLDTLAAPLLALVHGALHEIPDLITLVIIILLTRYVLKILHLFFINIDNGVIRFEGFRKEWIWPTHRLFRAGVFLCAVVICYPYIPGSGSAVFSGMSIFLGLVVSIGSNSLSANLLAGLIVVYKHSLNVGDRIRVGEIIGDIERVTLLDTLVRSLKNEMVSVPNSTLLSNQVINYSRTEGTDGLRIHATVGIGYDEQPAIVDRLLIEAATATPGLKADPPPFVLRTKLGSHDVSYEVNANLVEGQNTVKVQSDLHANILDRFNAAGVQIMTPFYVADPDQPKIPDMPNEESGKGNRS